MEDCHISYDSIVCMLELPMLAQGLDRCMNISQGVSMYMEAITILTIIYMQGYLSPPPPQPVPIFTSGIGETLWSLQYLAQEQDAMLQC